MTYQISIHDDSWVSAIAKNGTSRDRCRLESRQGTSNLFEPLEIDLGCNCTKDFHGEQPRFPPGGTQ